MAEREAAYLETLIAFEPGVLRTRSRADFVYDSLRDAIWEGRFANGVRSRTLDTR